MEITHLIIEEIQSKYSAICSIEKPNMIDLFCTFDNDCTVSGDIEVIVKVDDDLKVIDIVIEGVGFVHSDSEDIETDCTYNETAVISHFEGLLYGCFCEGYTYAVSTIDIRKTVCPNCYDNKAINHKGYNKSTCVECGFQWETDY